MNNDFKNKNTIISQTTINRILNEDLVLPDYGLYSNFKDVFSYPFVPEFMGINNTISLEQILRAKNNSNLMGLPILFIKKDPSIYYLPVNDTPEGAFTLLTTLNLLNPGDQCILKFSRVGYKANQINSSLYLANKSLTGFNVKFAYNNSTTLSNCLIFGKKADGPYTLIVVTNITSKLSQTDYKIEFRPVVFSICCNISNIPYYNNDNNDNNDNNE